MDMRDLSVAERSVLAKSIVEKLTNYSEMRAKMLGEHMRDDFIDTLVSLSELVAFIFLD